MRMLFDGSACGKGLNVKGKSAKGGQLSGFVPFLQIDNDEHKRMVGTSPATARTRVFYQTQAARDAARATLSAVLAEMDGRYTEAKRQLTAWKGGELELGDDARETALADMMLQCDPPTLVDIDDYLRPEVEHRAYGLDLPERLLWQAYVVRQDISHPPGWETGRASEPAFMDLNMQATRERKEPLAAIWQYDRDNAMNPRGLLIAHEEQIGIRPVASDIDAFLLGNKGMSEGPPLPQDQLEMVQWCLKHVEGVLQTPKAQGWTKRWLEVLKKEASAGFHPEMPEFGFGDERSYDIMVKAVQRLNFSGAVRHGAECFNFYFPQELDEQFMIVWDGFTRYYGNKHVPWAYVGREGLRNFLMARLEEGYTFPLNIKWILCDEGFRDIFLRMLQCPHAQPSLNTWLPPHSGLREKLMEILEAHPDGFQPVTLDGETVEMIDTDFAEWELKRHATLMRARAKLKAVYKFNKIALDARRSTERKAASADAGAGAEVEAQTAASASPADAPPE